MEEQRKRKRLRPLWASAWRRRPLRWDTYRPWGRWGQSVGFVTELWFMFASEAASIVVASLVIALACRGAVKPGSFAMWPGVAALVAGFAASAVFAQAGVALEMAPLLGVLYGIGQTVVSIACSIYFPCKRASALIYAWCAAWFCRLSLSLDFSVSGAAFAFDLVCALGGLLAVCYTRRLHWRMSCSRVALGTMAQAMPRNL